MGQEQRYYLPVDRPLTLEQMNRLTVHQLQTRDLNDPRYGGFDCHFDWHQYMTLDIRGDVTLLHATEKALTQIAATPEGQQSIRQAYAVRQHMRTTFGGIEKITVNNDHAAVQKFGTCATPVRGTVSITLENIQNDSYPDVHGKRHLYTLESSLYHELGHLKDALNLPENAKVLKASHFAELYAAKAAVLSQESKALKAPHPHDNESAATAKQIALIHKLEALKEFRSSVTEYPAMQDTNHFMNKYFGEAARAMNHMSGKAPSLLSRIFLPEGMNAQHTYDDFKHPPASPMCLPKTTTPHR